MYGQVDRFIAPCLWGLKGKKQLTCYLYSEVADDVLIQSQYISKYLVIRRRRMRLFGIITSKNRFKEISVERFVELK